MGVFSSREVFSFDVSKSFIIVMLFLWLKIVFVFTKSNWDFPGPARIIILPEWCFKKCSHDVRNRKK